MDRTSAGTPAIEPESGRRCPMKNSVCLLSASLAVVAVALLAALLEPGWAADLGVNGDGLADMIRVLRDPGYHAAALSPAEMEAFERRLAAKGRVADEVLDGR